MTAAATPDRGVPSTPPASPQSAAGPMLPGAGSAAPTREAKAYALRTLAEAILRGLVEDAPSAVIVSAWTLAPVEQRWLVAGLNHPMILNSQPYGGPDPRSVEVFGELLGRRHCFIVSDREAIALARPLHSGAPS